MLRPPPSPAPGIDLSWVAFVTSSVSSLSALFARVAERVCRTRRQMSLATGRRRRFSLRLGGGKSSSAGSRPSAADSGGGRRKLKLKRPARDGATGGGSGGELPAIGDGESSFVDGESFLADGEAGAAKVKARLGKRKGNREITLL